MAISIHNESVYYPQATFKQCASKKTVISNTHSQCVFIHKKTMPDTKSDIAFFYCLYFKFYFSIRIRASTATTALAEPRSGLRSISAISGAAFTRAEIRVTASAKRSSFTGS